MVNLKFFFSFLNLLYNKKILYIRCAGWVLYELFMKAEYGNIQDVAHFTTNWCAPSLLGSYEKFVKNTYRK